MIAQVKPDLSTEALPVDEVMHGDCLSVLKTLPDNSVDSCVTDPPYGLGQVKDLAGLLHAWLQDEDDRLHQGKSGFMSKEWDAGVPGPRYWKEVYRVMKPGAHLLVFAGTRTWDLMSMAIRMAGFENRDTIASQFGPSALQWMYSQGFPKSQDIGKAIDKHFKAEHEVIGKYDSRSAYDGRERASSGRYDKFITGDKTYGEVDVTAPATPEAAQWQGYGSALKPSWEPVLCFRKPLGESTIAANVLRWGTGALNIDACRVRYGNEQDKEAAKPASTGTRANATYASAQGYFTPGRENPPYTQPSGRWPSNTLLSHSVWCVHKGTKRVRANGPSPLPTLKQEDIYKLGLKINSTISYRDADGLEQVEEYECHESCPILHLDRQSGIRKSGGGVKSKAGHSIGMLRGEEGYHFRHDGEYCEPSTGGASRFFQTFHPLDDADDALHVPFYYCSKASRRERNEGLEGMPEKSPWTSFDGQYAQSRNPTTGERLGEYKREQSNFHPTVKPLQLMRYLIRLVTPDNGIVLDPFGGSGTTAIAAIQENKHFILIEKEDEYIPICEERILHAYGEVPE